MVLFAALVGGGEGVGAAVDSARAAALLRDSDMTQGCVLRHKRKRETGT